MKNMDIPGTEHLRSKAFTAKVIQAINNLLKEINKPIKLMHVCGTHEHILL